MLPLHERECRLQATRRLPSRSIGFRYGMAERRFHGLQHADGLIDGTPGDRLTHRLPTINAGTSTTVPGFLPAPPGRIANPMMATALPTHGPALQQCRPLPWD